jgi:hypothetical protein
MRKTILRNTILSLLGSTLIVASMANVVMAVEHHTRHHKKYASQRVRNVYGWQNRHALASENPSALASENRTVYWPKDENPFGPDTPWPSSGIQPDDMRQSVNK